MSVTFFNQRRRQRAIAAVQVAEEAEASEVAQVAEEAEASEVAQAVEEPDVPMPEEGKKAGKPKKG